MKIYQAMKPLLLPIRQFMQKPHSTTRNVFFLLFNELTRIIMSHLLVLHLILFHFFSYFFIHIFYYIHTFFYPIAVESYNGSELRLPRYVLYYSCYSIYSLLHQIEFSLSVCFVVFFMIV